jgi:hypothetical protein
LEWDVTFSPKKYIPLPFMAKKSITIYQGGKHLSAGTESEPGSPRDVAPSELAALFDRDPLVSDGKVRTMISGPYPAANSAVSAKRIDAYSVADQWLVDTGCGHDLISMRYAAKHKKRIVSVPQMPFSTAGGPVSATLSLPLFLSDLDSDSSNPYVLDDTPAVLSVGARTKKGFSFFWIESRTPCIVTPSKRIVPLDVIGDIPYLCRSGLHTTCTSPNEI